MALFQAQPGERKYIHDLKLAVLLSVTAGSVNSASFFAFDILTTNITGHVAVMANELMAKNWESAEMKLLWMLAFLAGSFFSGLCLEIFSEKNIRYGHAIPLTLEMLILSLVAYYGANYDYSRGMTQWLAGSLLFAMGLQNAMVTLVSGSVVRTTHLTGMFTDFGTGLARFIYRRGTERTPLRRRLVLQGIIILSFFAGGIIGAYLFAFYLFKSFLLPLGVLFYAIFYDVAYSNLVEMRRRLRRQKNEPTPETADPANVSFTAGKE